jgi:universal stress protein F
LCNGEGAGGTRNILAGAFHAGMAMFRKILVAVDVSAASRSPAGLDQAAELATASGGQLRLVNVQSVLPATFMEYVPSDFDEEQGRLAAVALDAMIAALPVPADRVSRVVRQGGIYHELLDEARVWGADLIVIGSHRPVMSDYLLGSNAKTIVRHAHCSVLVVRL